MSIIIPAVLPTSRAELDQTLARLAPVEGITTIQLDVVDGVFAEPASWPYARQETWELPLIERFRYEIDLMVQRPEEVLARFITLGASRITLHVESARSIATIVTDFKRRYGHEAGFTSGLLSFGLAFSIGTDTAPYGACIKEVDYVQFMGIATIGKQDQPFDERVVQKIRRFRREYPSVPLQVDGAVSLLTVPKLLTAGVSRLVVGSALVRASDISAALARFEALGERFGIYEH